MRKNNSGTRSLKVKRFINLRRGVLSAAIIAASQTAWVAPAMAGPEGGRVVDGAGSIGRDGRNTTIQQRTNRMVVDWDSYNVATDEVVTYVQPGRDSVALNRILSHSGSAIHGQINANGQVVLVNPHGVFFGENAQVNVGGLIASGMTVDVSDFMNGDFTFSAVDGADGKVINQGLINAATGGSVALLGKQVRNEGMISARLGAVNLAAGKEAVVTFDEAGLMGVRISKEILQDELGVEAAVLNTGEMTAQGGRILLSASTSRDIFSQAVNRGDLQHATSAVVHEDGSFTLGGGADVVNTGILNVSSADRGAGDIVVLGENITQAGTVSASTQSGTSGSIELHAAHTALLTDESLTAARAEGRGQGGQIKVLGHHVGLTDQATVDASGAWGGGQVYIGGDYQGDNPFMPNAWRSFVGEQTHIKANALAHGDGGRIIVWADDITRFFGSIEGKGAGENGTGGFAEVSGKELLRFDGLADMRGPGGVGTLLLDPRDITITDRGEEDGVGPDVSFDDGEIEQDVRIRHTTLQDNLNSTNVQLEASRNITVEAEVSVNAESENDLTLLAGNNINIESQINLGGGNLYLTAGVFNCGDIGCYPGDDVRSVEITGILNTRGTIDIRAADDINLAERIGNSGLPAAVSLRAGNNITITNAGHISVSAAPDTTAISLIAGDTTLATTIDPVPGGDGNLIIGGNLNSYGTADARGGSIVLNSSGKLTLNGDVITQGGHFTVGEPEGVRPSGFSMIGYTINTGTAYKNSEGGISRSSTGLDAGNITIYTSGSADLGVMSAALHYDTVDDSGGGNSIGAITVISGEDITLHGDLDFNDFGPRTTDGVRLGNASGESELSLTAGRNITLNGKIFDLWGDSRDALNIDLEAGSTLTLNNNIYTSGGNFSASAEQIVFGDEGAISTRFANDLEGEDTAEHGRHGNANWSTGGSVTLRAGTQMTLGKVVTHHCNDIASCTGNLTLSGLELGPIVTSPGINQKDDSHLLIAGTTTINIGTGTATLDSSDNRFLGPINGAAKNLTVSGGDDGLTFGALTLTGNLTATATGNITDITDGDADNIIRVDGLATFNTSENSLFLASRAHQLSAVDIVGNVQQVTLKNSRSLEVGAITTTGEGGAVDIETVGDLTVSGAIRTRGRDGGRGNPGVDGQYGGAIKLSASGALTVGKLDADGGARRNSQALGLDGGDITLEADQVILQGDISSRGSEGYGSNPHGTSGNITITGNTVIDPSGKDTISVDNTGSGGPETHSGVFKLDGTLNGGDRTGDDQSDNDDSGDDPAEAALFSLTINSSDVTFEGSIGNSRALGNLTINTYGDVNFDTTYFPQADSIQVYGEGSDQKFTAPDIAGEWSITQAGGGRLKDRGDSNAWIDFTGMSTLVGSNFDDQFKINTSDPVDLFIQAIRSNGESDATSVNTLTAFNRSNTWTIYGNGESKLNDSLTFTGMGHLIGGTEEDHFVLSGDDLFAGVLDGGEGLGNRVESTFDDGIWTLTKEYGGGLIVGSHELQFANIQTLQGSGTDSLQGLSQANLWIWTPDNGGSVALDNPDEPDSFTIDFSGMNRLIGGGVADRLNSETANGDWVMTEPHKGALTVSLADQEFVLSFENMQTLEGSGTDTLTRHDQNNHWQITGTNSGKLLIDGGLENDRTTYFSGMHQLVGGNNSDHFRFGEEGAVTGWIDGGATGEGIINTIVGRDTNNRWQIGVEDGDQWGSIFSIPVDDEDDLPPPYLSRFTGIDRLQGGAGSDEFIYFEGAQHITLDGGEGGVNRVDFSRLDSLTVRLNEGPMTDITNVQTLIGGGDGFSIGVANGTNRWELNSDRSGVLRHDQQEDESFKAEYSFINFAELVGGSGTDTLLAKDVENYIGNHWALNSSDGGVLTRLEPEERTGQFAPLTFAGMNHLIGGTEEDHFVLSGDYLFAGVLDGGAGAGNRLESTFADAHWTLTDHYNGTLSVAGHELRFENLQTLQGSGTDSLQGLSQENVWTWTPDNGGSVALDNPDEPDSFTIDFSGMNRLIGGGDSDRLNSETANGDWVMTEPHKGALTVSLADEEFVLSFENMQTLEGSGTDTLTRHDQNNHWQITGTNSGKLLIDGGLENDRTTYFSGMHQLVGGNNSDHFRFGEEGAVTGWIDGGATGEGIINTIVGRDTNNRWQIGVEDGDQWGSIFSIPVDDEDDLPPPYLSRFTGIDRLQGGAGSDEFIYQNGAQHIALDGGEGGANRVDFSRLDSLAVRLNEGPMTNITNVQTLIGGGDEFSIGVANGENLWELESDRSGVLHHDQQEDESYSAQYNFINFAELVGGSGRDTLVAADVDNYWTLSSSDRGTLQRLDPDAGAGSGAQLVFSGMNELVGGTEEDHFVLSGDDLFTGTVSGGTGSGNSVKSEFAGGSWALNGHYNGTLAVSGHELHFENIQTLEGSGSDSLQGLNQANVWHWTPEGGSVALDGSDAANSFAIDFSGMNRLIGGGVADRLNSTTANGDWVMTEPHKGALTVSLADDEFVLSFENMQTLEGSGTDTLTRHDQNNHWLITSSNAGMLMASDESGSGGIENPRTTYFSGMHQLIGGNNSDHFRFGEEGAVTGWIDGGATGEGIINTIVGRDTDNRWQIGVEDGDQWGSIAQVTSTDNGPEYFIYLTKFTGIDRLQGGAGSDEFIYQNGAQHIALDGGEGGANRVDFSRLDSLAVRLNEGPMTNITNVQTLIGGGDGFSIGVANGTNRWELNSDRSGVLHHDQQEDESFQTEYSFINFAELVGGSGTDTLLAKDVDNYIGNHWVLNSSDGGVLTRLEPEESTGQFSPLTFTGMDHLIGGTKEDHFVLSGDDLFAGVLDGGEGLGNRVESTFDDGSWMLTDHYNGTLTADGRELRFENLQTLQGSGTDSLQGLSQENVWIWTPDNGGSVALDNPDAPDSFTIDFSGMNRLIGGGVADRLNSETANGDWVMTEPHKGALTVSLADQEFVLSFENMQTLEGSGTDTLTRHDQNNHWLITSSNAGMLMASDESVSGGIENARTTYFSGMHQLIGGNNSDHFRFGEEGAVTGWIDGGATGEGIINTIVGRDTDNRWQIGVEDSVQSGSIAEVTSTDDGPEYFIYLTKFAGIDRLQGGAGSDEFIYFEGAQHITLDGGEGGVNRVDFSRLDSLTVRLNEGPMTDITNVQTLIGGGDGFSIGVANGENLWELESDRSGVLHHGQQEDESYSAQYNFINFAKLVGGSGSDTLLAKDVENYIGNHWALNSNDGGVLTRLEPEESTAQFSPLTFTGMNHLIGGTEEDHFVLSGNDLFTGVLDGGEGFGNRVESEFADGSWTLTEEYDGHLAVSGHELHFENIQTLEGSGSDSLQGLNQANVWHWAPEGGSVALDGSDAANSFAIDFSGMNRLIGGGVADRLNSETANGDWVMTEPHTGALTVSLADQEFVLSFENMQTLEGSGTDTLTRHDQNNHWLITSSNAGMLMASDESGSGGIESDRTTYFSGMYQLVGGNNSDHFRFGEEGAVTGWVDGGATGEGIINTIVGRDTNNRWQIGVEGGVQSGSIAEVTSTDDGPEYFIYLTKFAGIDRLQGGAGSDDFIYQNGAQHIALDGGEGGANRVDFSQLDSLAVRLNEGPMTDITNVQTLIGGGDGFSIGVANGENLWELESDRSGVLHHDQQEDESYSAQYNFINFAELVGGSESDTLVALNVANLWTLNSSDGGILTRLEPEESIGQFAPLTFAGMNHLIGGTEEDHFVLSGDDLFAGVLDGGAGAGNRLESTFADAHWTLTDHYNGTLSVAGHELRFENLQTLQGSGTDSLQGLSQENVWIWTPDNGGSVALDHPDAPDSFAVHFSGMNELIGGGVADRLNSETANGDWVMSEPHKGALTVSLADEEFVLSFENMQTLQGSGTDTLTRHDQNNHWLITSSNAGMLMASDESVSGGIENARTTYFSGMHQLIGGNNSDHFVLDALFSGILNGGVGPSGNSIDSNLGGGVWRLTGPMEGTLNSALSFENVQTLRGGRGDDEFIIESITRDALSSFSLIDGGTEGDNTLDLTGQRGSEALIIAVVPGWYEDAHLNIRGIHTVTARNNNNDSSEGNTLVGPDINTRWTVTGLDEGGLAYTEVLSDSQPIDRTMHFKGFSNLLGGSGNDRFDVESGEISGGIDGGQGTNWLDYSASDKDVVVNIGTSDDGLPAVSNIQGFIGNHNSDADNPFNSKLIIRNAASGSVNEWHIALLDEHNLGEIVSDGINDGVYNKGRANQFYFINFNELVGGAGNDTFSFAGDGQLTGRVDGGGGINTIDAAGSNLSHTFSFSDTADQGVYVQNVHEVNANDAHSNRLLGANRYNQWSITHPGGGVLNDQIRFYGFNHLIGGNYRDQFILSGRGSVGQIDGGGSGPDGPNTVRLEEGINRRFSIGLGAPDADIQLVNIGDLRASASDGHILVGAHQNNRWLIDDENAGKLNDQMGFTGFAFLRGNEADDTFVITGDGVITREIDGGDGGDNTLDLRGVDADRDLTIALRDTGNADFTLRNINVINSRADAKHTLLASNHANSWAITGTNAGSLGGLSFDGMANLVGGTSDDTFIFRDGGHITGLIDGGGYETENTLDYANTSELDIRVGQDNDFINIQYLIGNNANSVLRAANRSNHWTLTSGVNEGQLNDELRFTGITNLVGGSELDVFDMNGGALTGGIQAGKGDSYLNLTIGSGDSGRLRFFGGEGHNQILINGGDASYKARYAVDTAGEESLNYTGATGVHYELLYRDVDEVRDNVFADTLELVGGSHTEELVLRGNRFNVPGYSDLRFHNKHNLTLAATSQNHLKLEGRLDIPGTFEIRNARVSQDDNQARIEARRLILTGVAGFGSEGQSVNTHVDEVDIRLGRADLYLSNLGSLSLNELSGSGTIRVETEGALNSARDLKHSGSTSFISRFSDITLTGDNLLSGDITLAASGNIILKNTRDTRLQGVQAHNLSLTSEGDITAPGALTVDGLTALAADGDISLVNSKNNLRELEIQQAENVTVHAGHWMDLSSVYSRGDVYTRTEGLKLSGGITANNFQFDAGEGTSVLDGQLNVSTLLGRAQGITVKKGISIDTIELDSRGGTLALGAELETLQSMALRGHNVDQMAAIISGADLRVSSNANYNQRADTTAREDLRVTAESDITMETGVLSRSQNGEIHYQAGNSIALGGLDASGSTVSLTASRGAISNINNSDVNVTADRLEMHAATGIGRQASLLTDIHVLNAQTQTGRLALVNQADLQVDRMASNGNVRLSNRTGHIYLNTQDGPVFNTAESDALLAGGTLTGNYDLGTVVVEVPGGSLYGLGQAHAQKPDLVGREVIMLAPNGTVGSRNRPLVVYAKDLSSTIAGHTWPMWWAFDVRPNQVENDSGIPQELLDFASAGSHQMVEVESLEDINPAIFTEVRNYTYSNISVLLPPDQRYDDDDNQ